MGTFALCYFFITMSFVVRGKTSYPSNDILQVRHQNIHFILFYPVIVRKYQVFNFIVYFHLLNLERTKSTCSFSS